MLGFYWMLETLGNGTIFHADFYIQPKSSERLDIKITRNVSNQQDQHTWPWSKPPCPWVSTLKNTCARPDPVWRTASCPVQSVRGLSGGPGNEGATFNKLTVGWDSGNLLGNTRLNACSEIRAHARVGEGGGDSCQRTDNLPITPADLST